MLRGLDFMHFLKGDFVPPRYLSNPEETQITNSAYLHYQQQDQLVVAWLLASVSATILIKMVSLDSSMQIWECLTTHYAFHTRAMIKKPRLLLKTSKNDHSISTYIIDIKKTIDSLAAVGAPISTTEHVDAILDGLPEDYDGFLTSIISRNDPYNVDEIEALLLAQEKRFEKHRLAQSSVIQVNNTSTTWSSHKSFKHKPTHTTSCGGRSNNRFAGSRTPVCRVTADMCWHRYDPSPSRSFNVNITASTPYIHSDLAPSILGAPSTLEDPLWYPDSGATHHVTHDSNFFTNKQSHHGAETLKLGNNQGMEILHTGYAHYIVPHTTTTFVLRNLLQVPHITKHLISVAQFAKDNNVNFEFYANACYVKHEDTHQILLQGTVKDGLYVFPPSRETHAYIVNHAAYKPTLLTLQLWHNRLGHCNFPVVKHILRTCNVAYKPQTQFCNACMCGKAH